MIIWVFVLVVFIIISIINHLGIFTLSFIVPPWNEIILDIILLFITLGILYRMITMVKKQEKELLKNTIKNLVAELKSLKGETEEDKLIREAEELIKEKNSKNQNG